MAWILDSQKRKFKKFYEKTGIQLTAEPIGAIPDEISEEVEVIYQNIFQKPEKYILRLEKLVRDYPNEPSLKNYLFIAYANAGDDAKADRFAKKTLELHPKYIFNLSNLVMSAKSLEEVAPYVPYLGESLDIRKLKPEEEVFHYTEFAAYEGSVITYLYLAGREEEAIERFNLLFDSGIEKERLATIAKVIARLRLSNMADSLPISGNNEVSAKVIDKLSHRKKKEQPELFHKELQVFYEKSADNLEEIEIKEIIALPRASLIYDIEKILADSIDRYHQFRKLDWDEEKFDFLIHALYFLGALDAKESLEKVLDLFRKGGDFIEHWFSDFFEESVLCTLYLIGKDQLEVLKNFVNEGNIEPHSRNLVAMVVAQVAMHDSSRRPEVIQWFNEVYDQLLERPDDESIIDSRFVSWSLCEVVDLRAIELLPIIEKLDEKGWIDSTMQGDIEEIRIEIKKRFDPHEIEPIPENIYEFYNKKFYERKIASNYDMDEEFQGFLKKKSPAEELISQSFLSGLNFGGANDDDDFDHSYHNVATVKRDSPKVGRNEPCPCGSGKKYKKCCLKK